MKNTLKDSIEQMETIDKTKPMVLALSGGIDSMVLFDVLNTNGYSVIIAHVNHKQRSASDDEYTAIKRLAKTKNIPFEGLVIDETLKGNFQHEARKKRRQFFKSVADKYDTKFILTAHHLDDQIETLLMRLTKGYDITTFSAMESISQDGDYRFVRPFLHVNKADLIEYATTHNLTYYEDASNQEDTYMRNRIRQSVIPLLLEENPSLHETFKQTLNAFSDVSQLVNDLTLSFLNVNQEPIQLESFKQQNPLIQQHILKTLIKQHTDNEHPISQPHLTMLLTMLLTTENNVVHPITESINLHKEYETFFIAKRVQSEPISITITQEGLYPVNSHTAYRVTHQNLSHIYSNYMVLWYNEKVFPLYLRSRQPGDKILCSYGHKKLKSLFIDKKILPSQRDNMIVLANDKEVLWIPFLKMAYNHDERKQKKLYIYEVMLC